MNFDEASIAFNGEVFARNILVFSICFSELFDISDEYRKNVKGREKEDAVESRQRLE